MEILNIDVFDLYEDGTLVIKTNAVSDNSALAYAWYVVKDGRTIYKTGYQCKPFTVIKIDSIGSYTVKAWVRDENQNKIQTETIFIADKKTSPILVKNEVKLTLTPVIKNISGPFWQFSVEENYSESTKYAWYIYKEGLEEPIHKQMYSESNEYVYSFSDSGKYQVKIFALIDGNTKIAKSSDWFEVN